MFSLEFLIMVCVIIFCIGGLLGALVSRKFIPPTEQKSLENELDTTKEELSNYQHEVAEHFIATSKLINELTQSYKNVHEHLASGAVDLTNPDISKQLLDAGEGTLHIDMSEPAAEDVIEPPKDWAPKAPGDSGTLSEEFGLKEATSTEPDATTK